MKILEGIELKRKMHIMRVLSCFIWGNMRIAEQETEPQIALRNCCSEVEGKVNKYVVLLKGEYMQSGTFIF